MNAIISSGALGNSLELRRDPQRSWLELWIAPGSPTPKIVVDGTKTPRRAVVQIGREFHFIGTLTVWGDSPSIIIGDRCLLADAQICCGDHAAIEIGSDVTFGVSCNLNARHDGSIRIGNNSMLSSCVYIATDDMHAIREINTGRRINRRGSSVTIEDRVWVGFRAVISPGAHVQHDSIVGACAKVKGQIPAHVICDGVPAKIIREGVCWSQDDLP